MSAIEPKGEHILESQIEESLFGRLSTVEQEAVGTHLKACLDCRLMFGRVFEEIILIQYLLDPVGIPMQKREENPSPLELTIK